ncbi:hypothetical protein FHS57_006370 [Runella defluvii]|uniref:Integrase catalytic domain-containing protein n=1 Tax=Runella defluvii TaxID=370973 RepID=A0A7W6EU13_9BACT|nr:hypothetical protein [Runella defluvii]
MKVGLWIFFQKLSLSLLTIDANINILDECSIKDLWVEAHEHIKAIKLTEILDKLVLMRGYPAYIRTDNGPISDELAK